MNNNFPIAYAIYNNNIDIRMNSTSGGIFTLLATYFIESKHAVVYGASFTPYFEVTHIRVSTLEDLGKLRGSKYPQSKMGDTFRNVKNDLISGLTVFFTGTPCEIAGLKKILNNKYDNQLICMDFVCHGVASDLIWREYLKGVKKKSNIANITFKSKLYGWKKWYFSILFTNGKKYQVRGSMNTFMRSFLSYNNIRPSCYECQFKGLARQTDFTISDCWGVGEKNLEINDDKGLSALLIQNDRANLIFEAIKKDATFVKYPSELLMEGNWTMLKSVPRPENREVFFSDLNNIGSNPALYKHFKPTYRNWIRYFLLKLEGKEK